mmetsp:Transcript_2197/g.3743  ORF Transcript_2197/g.3743 Transcript_2197/m.3743 type:complete len:282 (-) Transcript_2197:86-931(-)|eukprot:CAMPEP_0198213632 /NCGR_PEP_ID=MMETSP1445-20131203/28979_1 /TAXON_ID=36898 /ORGANISM="Pyramimonas sp., Strain CCMP2087" /LENGTH=281 /DNA_ID=CAMNT_0043888303 /DNA_START=438 /DNA_END=1286 /DNA_ORIENTATION=-
MRSLLSAISAIAPVQGALRKLGFKTDPFFLPLIERLGAPFYAVILCLVDLIPFVPCGPAAFTSGVLYGTYKGLAIAMFGQAMAAVFAFLIGRHVIKRLLRLSTKGFLGRQDCRPNCRIQGIRIEGRFKAVLDGLDKSGFKKQFATFALLRQSPLVPFSVCNYSVGALTRLPIYPFISGTFLGCIPGNVLMVSAGAAARAGHQLGGGHEDWAPLLGVIGVLATGLLVYGATRLATQELQAIQVDEEEIDSLTDGLEDIITQGSAQGIKLPLAKQILMNVKSP